MKAFRHGQILKIIQGQQIHTQEELARELAALGVSATQVTLSRDIRELGLVKTKDGYTQLVESSDRGTQVDLAVLDYLLDIRPAQQILVLKTPPAFASSLAIAIDKAAWSEVAGTIAGDDTVLVVCGDVPSAAAVHARLLEILRGAG
jgi:transcriptional regulator of arginine metabolism